MATSEVEKLKGKVVRILIHDELGLKADKKNNLFLFSRAKILQEENKAMATFAVIFL